MTERARQLVDTTPDDRAAFVRPLQFRFACKMFDESRKVAPADLTYILEAGQDEALRRRLRPSCWNQVQITTASAVIVILALKTELAPGSDYPHRMLSRRLPPGADLDETMKLYRDIAHEQRAAWSAAQCHIAAANMMTAAAMIGIDTCPMGGFEPEGVAEVLGISRTQYTIALLLAVGYRAQPQPPKQRLPLDAVVTYR